METQLLVPLHTFQDGNTERLAPHVGALARQLNAEIHALAHVVAFGAVSSPFGRMLVDVPEIISSAKANSRARAVALIAAIRRESSGAPLTSSEAECLVVEFGSVVAESARYHDFVLVGMVAGEAAISATAEAAVFGAGRPVVLVPETAEPSPLDRVVIAWDGSRFAARAVSDAQILLRRAKSVSVVVVVDEKPLPGQDLGQKLVHFLGRHAISAETVHLTRGIQPIGDALQRHALDVGANLLVMGGFGHSRVRDFVLGGATRGIMKELRMAALLSH